MLAEKAPRSGETDVVADLWWLTSSSAGGGGGGLRRENHRRVQPGRSAGVFELNTGTHWLPAPITMLRTCQTRHGSVQMQVERAWCGQRGILCDLEDSEHRLRCLPVTRGEQFSPAGALDALERFEFGAVWVDGTASLIVSSQAEFPSPPKNG